MALRVISPRWRKVFRDVWLHKPRTTLTVLAIVIGIIGAASVLNAWSLIRQATRDEYRASNPASATLLTDSIDARLLAAIRARADIRNAEARRTVIGSARASGMSLTTMLFAVEDFSAIRIGHVLPEEGAWPPPEGTLVLERSSVEFAQVTIGDSLTLSVGDAPPRALRVSGIARDVGLAPGWMDHLVYAFVNRSTLAQLGVPSSLNALQIVVSDPSLDRAAVRRIAYEVKAEVERMGHRVGNVDVPVPGRHIHAGQIESLLLTQLAFGALALFLSAFLVVNLITAMLAGQVREIGTMKAIGARNSQVAGMYLGLAFLLGLIASAVALPAAAIIGRVYAQFTADLLNFSIAGLTVPSRIIALQLAVGILLPVAAAAIPVIRGCRLSVAAALRDFGIAEERTGKGVPLARHVSGLTRPMLLSLRNAFRRRQRVFLTLLTLATGGAVYLGALNLRASIIRSVDLLFRAQRHDLALRFVRTWPGDSLEAVLSAIPGVAVAEAWSAGSAASLRSDGTLGNSFTVVAPPPGSTLFTPFIVAGRWMRSTDTNSLVVNTRLMEDEPLMQLGAAVTLMIGGRPSPWTIVGVVEEGTSPSAYAPRASVAAILSDGRVDRAMVAGAAKGSASLRELVARLRPELARRGYAVQSSQLVEENRSAIEDHLLLVGRFLGVMSQVMIVVGGLGLAATMSLAVLERTREIGVLRAIGARHRDILAMIQIEGLVISIASWAIALPLSVPMSVVLGRAFGRVMIPVPITFVPELSGVLQWLLVVILVSIASCAWPALRATRITTAAALAYE